MDLALDIFLQLKQPLRVEISPQQLPSIYADLMRQLKRRLNRVKLVYQSAVQNNDRLETALDLEQCVLQIRLSIELIAVGTLCAHNELEEFRSSKLFKSWNAENLLTQLSRLSDDAFPRPVTVTEIGPDGVADMFLHEHNHYRAQVIKLYSRCGDLLHTGTLKGILRDGGKLYDPEEIRNALNFIINWIDEHAILLPGGSRMLVSFLRYAPTNDVHCFLTDVSPDQLIDPRDFPQP